MPGAKSKHSEKCYDPHKTGCSQKHAVVPVKHVVTCLTALLMQTSWVPTAFSRWNGKGAIKKFWAMLFMPPAGDRPSWRECETRVREWLDLALPCLEDPQVVDIGGVLTSSVARYGLLHSCVHYCKSSKRDWFV